MKRRICLAIVVMGFSGLVAEILLMRELLIVFSGNELCIGIITANWLILEAIGSYFLGKKVEKSHNSLEILSVISVLFSFWLFAAVFLTRILKNVTGISIGEPISFLLMLYSSFLLLLPVGILHGATFALSCRIYATFSSQDANSAGKVYVYETVGTLIGGIACTYLFVPYLNTFQEVSWIALLNLIISLGLLCPYWKKGLIQKGILVTLTVLFLVSGLMVLTKQTDKLHRYSINLQWKNHKIVHYQNSQYGNICILEEEGQYIFFQDGIPGILTPVPDSQFVGEFVHLPLLIHPDPRNIMILSGGAGGVIHEALKYSSIETIEYAELDPLLLDLFRHFPTPLTESELNDSRVKIKSIDGRLFVQTTKNTYDLILVGIMEPSNLQSNRFFTQEFFYLVKSRLNNGGMLVMGLPGSLTYLTDELRNLNSSIVHTLISVFSYIRVIPGDGTNLFLVSDSPEIRSIDGERILGRLQQRDIQAEVITPRFVANKLHHGWQDWFPAYIEGGSEIINSDFKPVGLFYNISHWNALYAPSLRWLFGQFEKINLRAIVLWFAIILLFCFFFRSKIKRLSRAGIPLSIISTGFAGMIFDLMVIFTFQSFYGYVFSWIGFLMACFMTGAACGAILATQLLARTKDCFKLYIKIELALICFSFVCPFILLVILRYLRNPGIYVFRILFLVISFICGLLIGSQFPLANRVYQSNSTSLSRTAGLLYACDLLGGWLGGILGAVVLLPVLGLAGTGISVGLLKLASFIVLTTQSQAI